MSSKKGDENDKKYKLGDYRLIQCQILQTNVTGIICQNVWRIILHTFWQLIILIIIIVEILVVKF